MLLGKPASHPLSGERKQCENILYILICLGDIEVTLAREEGAVYMYLCCFDNLCEVVQDGPDVVFQSLVVVLQQSLFALREHSLSGHRAQEKATQ